MKMTPCISNEQLEQLKLLRKQSSDTAISICKCVHEYLNSGPNIKQYASVAAKLNITLDNLTAIIKALLWLIIDSVKYNVSQADFESALYVTCSPEHLAIYWQFINERKEFIKNILKHYNTTHYRYRDLEWRLESRIASRCLLLHVMPIITVKMYLDSETINENKDNLFTSDRNYVKQAQCRQICFQVDPSNLLYIINVLEQALDECKTHRTKNFVKAFNAIKL